MRGNFGAKQRYEFQTSSYQMLLLLLFNDHEVLTYQQILQITQIPVQELHMHLIPLIKCKLIVKNPAANSFSAEDEMRVNMDYKSNLFRNKLPVMVSKATKENDSIKVQGKVEDDRRYTIEASIIKVMKARRKIEYVNLVSETSRILSLKFNPEPA